MNVLAIGCHPDDVEIACAGTLLKCAKRGDRVIVCHVCNGNMGHVVIEPDELGPMRNKEAEDAGKIAGFEVITCDIGDLLPNAGNMEQRNQVVDVIRYANPDFIITHSPTDYMPDHVGVSRLVFDAAFSASCPHYRPGKYPASKITPIYYMDNLAGTNFTPTMYVDVSDEMETKIEMLECHVSQLKWMRDHDHIDFADFVRTCSKYRGYQSNCEYAEAFYEEMAYPKVQARRLLP